MIAQESPTNIDSVDLALTVLNYLKLYGNSYEKDKLYDTINSPLKIYNGKWQFLNPVNSKDNLLDAWNENKESAKIFFEWAKEAQKDLQTILDLKELNYIDIIGNSFGNKIVDKTFKRQQIKEIKNGVKPYYAE